VNVLDDPILAGGGLTNQTTPEAPTTTTPTSLQSVTPGSEEGFAKFLLKSNGVLFENEVLQIGVKSEYKKNLGEMGEGLERGGSRGVWLRDK